MKIYMKLSKDKYRLPVEWAYSVDELAEKSGNSKSTIDSILSKVKHGVKEDQRFIVVEVDMDDEVSRFYDKYEEWKRKWKLRMHTRSTMEDVKIEIFQRDTMIVRVIGEDEKEAYSKALWDLEYWIEGREKEREKIHRHRNDAGRNRIDVDGNIESYAGAS